MGNERTYPRKWYRVSRSGGEIQEREFVRETNRMLFYSSAIGERREIKSGAYGTWYPERAEAEAATAARDERIAEKARQNRIRNTAPALLEALEEMVAELDELVGHYRDHSGNAALARARAAISLARGEEDYRG